MTMNPADYDVPDRYQHWEGDKAEDHIGPFFFYMDGDYSRTVLRVESHHCNAYDSTHGGVLMALADYTLCLAANGGSTTGDVITVSCNHEFIAPAYKGDLIAGRGEVLKKGGSLVFTRCELHVDESLILVASAVLKRLPMTVDVA